MIKNKKAESLVGIIIAVFILGFTMLGILNIFGFNKGVESTYKDRVYAHIMKGNSENLIKRLDVPNMSNNEFFYIEKDIPNKSFNILTGTINEGYKYVDFLGNKVNPSNNIGKTYTRLFQFKADILRHVIYPGEIPDMVFWYDANNTDGNNNSGVSYGSVISILKDLSGNGIDASQTDSSKKPILTQNVIKDKAGIKFDGNDDLLKLSSNIKLNNDEDNYANRVFEAKTYSIVFKTGDDVTSDQVIYEEGGAATGYNFMIHEGNLYAGVHNRVKNCNSMFDSDCKSHYTTTDYSSSDTNWYFEWDDPDGDGNRVESVDLGQILPSTIYFITIIQDSTHFNNPDAGDGVKTEERDPIDLDNKLKIYLNGNLVKEVNHVDPMPEHHIPGLGNINEWSVRPRSPFTKIDKDENLPFNGYFGEFISWNHALSNTEVVGLQNYFEQKWYDRIDNIKYNIIKTNSYKFVD